MKKSYKSGFSNLRQKAEELLITKISKSDSPLSETDTLKLIHELDVHQIELELQNKELPLDPNLIKTLTKTIFTVPSAIPR